MAHLLNDVTFFGKPIDLNSQSTTTWLILIQVLIVVAIVSIILYFVLRDKFKKDTSQEVVPTVAQSETSIETVYQEPDPIDGRVLTGISLHLENVQRDFKAGDQFTCEGLIVYGEYNLTPTSETLLDYTVLTKDTYVRLKRRGKIQGVYVIKPSMDILGNNAVTVMYEEYSANYMISVYERSSEVHHAPEPIITINVEQPIQQGSAVNVAPVDAEPVTDVYQPIFVTTEQQEYAVEPQVVAEVQFEQETNTEAIDIFASEQLPHAEKTGPRVVVEEDTYEATLRYDRSFMARLIQSEDEIKHWYTDIKNNLLSYKGVKSRVSWKRETFKCGGKLVLAKLAYRGKVLCVFLPLKHADYYKDYPVENASDMSCYDDTPLMIRLKNAKRVEIAKELIKTVMLQNGMISDPHESVDYYMPYEGTLNLINKGLVKRLIRTSEHEAIFTRTSNEEDDDELTLTKVAPGIYVTKKD